MILAGFHGSSLDFGLIIATQQPREIASPLTTEALNRPPRPGDR